MPSHTRARVPQTKLVGTPMQGCIDKLLSGSTVTTTRCLNVDYESPPRVETFFDVQLDVKVR